MEKSVRLVRLIALPIDLQSLAFLDDWSGDLKGGATVKFLGTVRQWNQGKQVLEIYYEAYIEMAEPQLNDIVEEAFQKWPLLKCAVIHRTGRLTLGEVAVAIYVTSVHRKEAFNATQYIIDELKKRVPIWKKEIYENGEEWLGSHCHHSS